MLKGHHYQNLQLKHAMKCQRRHSNQHFEDSAFLESIYTNPEKKDIISRIYAHLLSHIQAPDLAPCREGWEREVSPIDSEQWDHILGVGPLVSVSAAQRLSHLFILHRVYHTTVQLHKWGRRDTPICLKCQAHTGDLIHMLSRCPKLVRYWNRIVNKINKIYQVQLVVDPLMCLLGRLTEELYPLSVYITLTRLLYLARKLIARLCLSAQVPTEVQWIQMVNNVLTRERNTYYHRKSLKKMYKHLAKLVKFHRGGNPTAGSR